MLQLSVKEEELRQLCSKKSLDFKKIKMLMEFGIDVNGKNKVEWNALHFLCWNNSSAKLIDAIKLLIQLGIDVKSNGIDARILLQNNSNLKQQKETIDGIIQILDRAALEKAREK